MSLKTTVLLLFSIFGLTINLHAQDNTKQQEEKRKYLQERVVAAKREKALKQESVQVQTNKYNHKENEILAKVNTESIPEDFPVYKSEYTDEQYSILMNKWYSSHPTLLKTENNNQQK